MCVSKKKGLEVKEKEKRWMPWVCAVTTCEFLRGMMGPLSDLQVHAWCGRWLFLTCHSQVAEEIIEAGDDPNFCYIADGATSEGKELYAQMLSRRVDGKLEHLLANLEYSGKKTADAKVPVIGCDGAHLIECR